MAKVKQRISVVRIPRQFSNQTNRNVDQDDTDKGTTTSHLKAYDLSRPDRVLSNDREQNDTPITKTDLFTITDPPQTSVVTNGDLNRRKSSIDLLQSPVTIQHQPTRVDTWIKPSLENRTRPYLSWKATGKWTHDLFSVFDDSNMCCYACACWCCFRHEISSMMNEHWLVWFVNCSPLMELRTKFRQQYAIRGSIAEDCCLSTCCPLCVALQLANEGRNYGHRIFS